MKNLLKSLQTELTENKEKSDETLLKKENQIQDLRAKNVCVEKDFRILNNKYFKLQREVKHQEELTKEKFTNMQTKFEEEIKRKEEE